MKFKQNSYISIQENAFENIVCEMAAILSRPQCVKSAAEEGTQPNFDRGVPLMDVKKPTHF